MKCHISLLGSLFLLAACTQAPAPVDYKGSRYFGRDATYDSGGMELPKYSDDNRAELPPEQEEKFRSDTHEYGVAAEIGSVASTDLPPPTSPLQASPPPAQAVEAMRAGEQNRPVDPAFNQPHAPGEGYYDYAAQKQVPPIAQSEGVTVPPAPVPDPNATQVAESAPVDYYSMESAELEGGTASATAATNATPQFIWPVQGDVLSAYSAGSGGMSIRARKGDPIRASDDGTVRFAGSDATLGSLITIEHAGGWATQYGHVGEIVVKSGDVVVRGQLVGFVGATGGVSEPQLYFSVRRNGAPSDPKPLLVND